jgi:uncharacterized SAM-binding protein YcdF (DUF218 family)
MDVAYIFEKLGSILFLPPAINFLLIAASFALFKFKRLVLAKLVGLLSIVSLFLLSLPVVSDSLNSSLQTIPALTQEQVKKLVIDNTDSIAIVVLAGGRISQAAEYGEIDTVSAKTLQRVHYAAWLHKKTNIPILVSGGSVFGEPTAEAVLVNQVMVSAYTIAPRWIEPVSKNTAENAKFASQLLIKNGIKRILLVTHANHMPKALAEFERHGLKITPAPTVFQSPQTRWTDYLPSAKGLFKSQQALHEMLGRAWYSI